MRLIDADVAYEVFTEYYHQRTPIQHMALREALSRVPTAEPKKGKWEDVEEVVYEGNTGENPYTVMEVGYKCSVCGTEVGYLWNFCPNCGARMESE